MDLDTLKTHPYEFLKMIADTESNKCEQGGFRPGETWIIAATTPRQIKTLYGMPKILKISLEQEQFQDRIRQDLIELCTQPKHSKHSTANRKTIARPDSQNYLDLRKTRW